MMKNYTLFFATCLAFNLNAQIITEVSSLPEVGDVLNYQTLSTISEIYLLDGENVTWDFTQMLGDEAETDVYAPASDGAEADEFPEADILFQFGGANAYAKRNTTNIEIIGVAVGELFPQLEGLESQGLSSPFVFKRAPLGFEDTFDGEASLSFSQWIDPASTLGTFVQGLAPAGSSIDSLRGTIIISRTEEVDGWGTAVFQNEEVEALRLVQTDERSVEVEFFVNTALIDTWVDLSDFLDPEALGFGEVITTNYIFLGATNKEHLLEVNVDNTNDVVTGRFSSEYYVGINELDRVEVSVFPNPTSDEILVDGVNISTISILDQSGREVYTGSERLIDVSELSDGTYFIQGETREGELFFSRFIKQ